MTPIQLCERGYVPDAVARFFMRRLIAQRLRQERSAPRGGRWLAELESSPIAIETAAANEQHYEVPPAFFDLHLGPRLKYSCCFYEDGDETLGQAEDRMLALYAERAGIEDGMRILDLGCGWGSLSLYLAQRFPASQVVGLSNSHGQRQFILQRAAELKLSNLTIRTGNVAEFEFPEPPRFDRILSIEMFEHMRNYRLLLAKLARWLDDDGKLFVHLFAHRSLAYPFEEKDESDWMTRYFFRGGQMPSENLLAQFQADLSLQRQWWVRGTHYERTANDWLAGMDAQRDAILKVFERTYGAEAKVWLQRWRMFYMAVAELFGYRGGQEWGVAHYLFSRRGAQAG